MALAGLVSAGYIRYRYDYHDRRLARLIKIREQRIAKKNKIIKDTLSKPASLSRVAEMCPEGIVTLINEYAAGPLEAPEDIAFQESIRRAELAVRGARDYSFIFHLVNPRVKHPGTSHSREENLVASWCVLAGTAIVGVHLLLSVKPVFLIGSHTILKLCRFSRPELDKLVWNQKAALHDGWCKSHFNRKWQKHYQMEISGYDGVVLLLVGLCLHIKPWLDARDEFARNQV